MNRIAVNGSFLETTSLIAQSFRVNNLGDISTRQGSSSNNFSFPLTASNREALGFPEDPNETARSPYLKIDAELYDGDVFLSNGYLKINSVDEDSINTTFFSDNAGWFNEIKDKTLKDITTLSVYDHIYNEANITASFSNTEGYIYPIIDYGEFGAATLGSAIEVEQLFTGMYVKTLFKAIFDDAGYTINGDMLDLWEYNNSIIPFSAEDFNHGQGYIEANTLDVIFTNLFPSTITFTTGGAGDIQYLTNTLIPSVLTPNEPGKYLVTVELDISNFNIAFGQTANAILYRDRFGVPTVVETFFTFTSTSVDGVYSLTKEVDLDPATDFDLTVGISYTTSGTIFDLTGANTFFRIVPAGNARIQEGATVNIIDILPDIGQADFVKYMVNTFGAIPQTDKVTNNIDFGLFRNIKGQIVNARDWSDKIDGREKTIDFTEIVGKYGQVSIFEYIIDDNDNELGTYKSQNRLDFGFGELTINNQHISNRKVIYTAPFGSTINIVSFSNELYIPQIRWLDDMAEKDVTPVPRILLVLVDQSVEELTGGEYEDITVGATTADEIPFCWFVKAPYTETTNQYTQSLSYGDITFTENVEGTLTNFWSEYQDALSSIKYVTANFALNSVDVIGNDFGIPVYIDRFKSYFYVNSINEFSGSDQLTEVELIKIA